ncbi:reverse transcriptase zinc-binding domain-containing protein [Artemisia annua]|uniref:Reverse transcriptase zinc-binding domain-containing protein n=1 Tax=Artemisia annua TaxID=35608 RepID=A0A2U1PRG3_ARTAN|nr:reverse transcriptase zinc-binding domain-containing protein [Artemisia annua]
MRERVWNKAMLMKHVWHIAVNKDTLWVKWVNIVKLKGKSIWEINEDVNDSWGWKNILKLRQTARAHMVMEIGDGDKASMWFDIWDQIGALNTFITYRDLHNARWKADMTVKEFVVNHNGQWSVEWMIKYPQLSQIQTINLSNGKSDTLRWKNRNGGVGKFTVSQVYKHISEEVIEAKWYRLIWFSQNIPKHAFILWLAVQNKLTTQDMIIRWGSYDMMVCSLCMKNSDSHDHLFFECDFSSQLRNYMQLKLGIKGIEQSWVRTLEILAEMYNGNSIGSVLRRISLAACVCFIWQERNFRLFRGISRKWEEVLKTIIDTIRLRMMSLHYKPSLAVSKVEEQWDVKLKVCAKSAGSDG